MKESLPKVRESRKMDLNVEQFFGRLIMSL